MRTANSQNTASPAGSSRQSGGRSTGAAPAFGPASGTPACWPPAVMEPRDTAEPPNAISPMPTADRRTRRASVRSRHVAIVDELIDRFLDVDAGADHARLLQRKPGLEN